MSDEQIMVGNFKLGLWDVVYLKTNLIAQKIIYRRFPSASVTCKCSRGIYTIKYVVLM